MNVLMIARLLDVWTPPIEAAFPSLFTVLLFSLIPVAAAAVALHVMKKRKEKSKTDADESKNPKEEDEIDDGNH